MRKNSNILTRIHKAGSKLLEPLTIQDTHSTILTEAVRLVKAEQGSIFLKEKGRLKRVFTTTPGSSRVEPRKDGFTYKAFKNKEALVLESKKIKRIHPEFIQAGVQSIILIPLVYQNKSMGVLTLQSSKVGSFTKHELDTLKLFGSIASLAIKKTHLYEEARKALETRDLFISLASHELRTPLTTINGYIQLLHNRLAKSNGIEAKWTQDLKAENTRMTNLVNDLLEVNKIRSGKVEFYFKECSLREIVRRVTDVFNMAHPKRSILLENQLKNSESDLIVGDFDKLMQLLYNLLDNAAKFSPGNLPIKIVLKSENNHFTIQVKDQGKGIDKQDLAKVFEGFFKGSNGQEEKGLGVGLFLTKYIITAHKGSITIDSAANQGTTVEVTLQKTPQIARKTKYQSLTPPPPLNPKKPSVKF